MTHLILFVLSLGGFAALALAMDRHQDDLFGHALAPRATRAWRVAGWAALLAALACAVRAEGWGLGLVSLTGHAGLGAGLVALALVVHQRLGR